MNAPKAGPTKSSSSHQNDQGGVIIVQRIFPQYRKAVFDAIYRQVRFTLLHSDNLSGIKQTMADYSVAVSQWKYGGGDTKLFLRIFSYIRKNRPNVVIHEMAVGILSLPVAILRRKSLGYKLILWGHTYNRKAGFNPKSWSDRYRLWMQRKADAIITYSNGEKKLLVEHGISEEKIFPALNTLDTDRYFPVRNELERIGREEIKRRLGFRHDFNLIFIGRLYEDKWPQHAVEVLEILLRQKSLSIALHFVGSGEMEASLMTYCHERGLQQNVFFHKEVYDERRTGELLFASDMMIMPGCVGLSVNHAFCFDCPVITFAGENNIPAHGPEIEYVLNGVTGFIVPSRNVNAMADTLLQYLNDETRQQEMKQHVRNMIENNCPIGKLTAGFIDAINYVNKN